MIDKHQRAIDDFGVFVRSLVRDLNHLSEDGWSVLVEGQRDEEAPEDEGPQRPACAHFRRRSAERFTPVGEGPEDGRK